MRLFAKDFIGSDGTVQPILSCIISIFQHCNIRRLSERRISRHVGMLAGCGIRQFISWNWFAPVLQRRNCGPVPCSFPLVRRLVLIIAYIWPVTVAPMSGSAPAISSYHAFKFSVICSGVASGMCVVACWRLMCTSSGGAGARGSRWWTQVY